MRLTNEMRSDFADLVVSKIPLKYAAAQQSIKEELEKRMLALWPKEVLDFRCKYPKQTNITSVYVSWLTDPRYVRRSGTNVSCINGSNLEDIDCEDLKALHERALEEIAQRNRLRNSIYEQALACTTLAKLREVFPDLHGLMPKPVVEAKSLPVAAKGLIDEMVKLGLEIPQ